MNLIGAIYNLNKNKM